LPRWQGSVEEDCHGKTRDQSRLLAQGAIATLRPLVNAGLIPADLARSFTAFPAIQAGGRSMIEEYEQNGESANAFAALRLTLTHKHLPEMQAYSKTRQGAFVHAGGRAIFRQGMIVTVRCNCRRCENSTGAQLHAAIADHYAAIPDSFVEVALSRDSPGSTPNLQR